jgi:hypothetical protein
MRIFSKKTSIHATFITPLFISLVLLSTCFSLFATTQEALGDSCDVEVTQIFRNSQGDFIPDISFEFYEQAYDVNNNPKPGKKVASGKINKILGRATIKFQQPYNYSSFYVLKAWHKNANVGEFWFPNIPLSCGIQTIEKTLSGVHFVLRDIQEDLRKNTKFSIYTQRYDVDGAPIKEKQDFVTTLNTSEEGEVTLYIADSNHFLADEIGGHYVFTATGKDGGVFTVYDIFIPYEDTLEFEYTFSNILFHIKNAGGDPLAQTSISIYKQDFNLKGEHIFGKKLKDKKTDDNGEMLFEYPEGTFAAKIKDDQGKYFEFWNINMEDQKIVNRELKVNLIRVYAKKDNGALMPEGTNIKVYNVIRDDKGYYYKNKKIKDIKTTLNGYAEISLVPDVYLFAVENNKIEYGRALYAKRGTLQNITLIINPNYKITDKSKYKVSVPPPPKPLVEKLSGYILLQVEKNGEAWYVDAGSRRRYYMKDGAAAYKIMRNFGLGITNENLNKIPIGVDSRFNYSDYDDDGLPDKMEEALGTDSYNSDSDLDGYLDGEEVKNGYNPLGSGKLKTDSGLVEKLKGKILLQVESKGEAWYVNPRDGKRYYMKDGESAYEIMRFLSLGITNENLSGIEKGILKD